GSDCKSANDGEFGPVHRDIKGKNPNGSIRGPFSIEDVEPTSVPTILCSGHTMRSVNRQCVLTLIVKVFPLRVRMLKNKSPLIVRSAMFGLPPRTVTAIS